MYRLVISMVPVVLLLFATSCAPTQQAPATTSPPDAGEVAATAIPEPPAREPQEPGPTTGQIEGNISNIERVDGDSRILGRVRIEGEKNPSNEYDKAVITVSTDTLIYRRDGDALIPVTFDDLEFGQTVVARFSGPIMESYPIQVGAGEIVILAQTPKN
jgi:hypothetical protein